MAEKKKPLIGKKSSAAERRRKLMEEMASTRGQKAKGYKNGGLVTRKKTARKKR